MEIEKIRSLITYYREELAAKNVKGSLESDTPVNRAIVRELEQEMDILETLLKDPSGFAEAFKKRCRYRESVNTSDTCLNFIENYEGECNILYWQIALLVFNPGTLREMFAILMPSVKFEIKYSVVNYIVGLTKVDVDLKLPVEIDTNQLANYIVSKDTVLNFKTLYYYPHAGGAIERYELLKSAFPELAAMLRKPFAGGGFSCLTNHLTNHQHSNKIPSCWFDKLGSGLKTQTQGCYIGEQRDQLLSLLSFEPEQYPTVFKQFSEPLLPLPDGVIEKLSEDRRNALIELIMSKMNEYLESNRIFNFFCIIFKYRDSLLSEFLAKLSPQNLTDIVHKLYRCERKLLLTILKGEGYSFILLQALNASQSLDILWNFRFDITNIKRFYIYIDSCPSIVCIHPKTLERLFKTGFVIQDLKKMLEQSVTFETRSLQEPGMIKPTKTSQLLIQYLYNKNPSLYVMIMQGHTLNSELVQLVFTQLNPLTLEECIRISGVTFGKESRVYRFIKKTSGYNDFQFMELKRDLTKDTTKDSSRNPAHSPQFFGPSQLDANMIQHNLDQNEQTIVRFILKRVLQLNKASGWEIKRNH